MTVFTSPRRLRAGHGRTGINPNATFEVSPYGAEPLIASTILRLSRLGCSDPNESNISSGMPVLNRPTLTPPLEAISVSSLFCAIAANRHTTPPARMTMGSIDEEKRTGRSLASFHIGEVLCADEVRERSR